VTPLLVVAGVAHVIVPPGRVRLVHEAAEGQRGTREGGPGRQLGLDADFNGAFLARGEGKREPVHVGRLVLGSHGLGVPGPVLLLLDGRRDRIAFRFCIALKDGGLLCQRYE